MTGARREFPREIGSLGEVFDFLQDFESEHELDERTAFSINLVVEELFTNMVRHNIGGSEHISLALDHDDDNVYLELVDVDVEPFDFSTVATVPVEEGLEARRPGGLGVHLVQRLVDDVTYEYDTEDRRMRVSVKKSLEP